MALLFQQLLAKYEFSSNFFGFGFSNHQPALTDYLFYLPDVLQY